MGKKQGSAKSADGVKVLVRNRRARHDYQLQDRFEAGIVLTGSEVKSLRDARASMTDAYAAIRGGEAWLLNMQINEYPWAHQQNHEPKRDRKLLLHRHELKKLAIKTQQRGLTLVPLSVYLKEGRIKVELALASGKRQHEKREAAKERTAQREIDQAMRRARR